ncbi:MAG: type II toxin-antitoxin system HipA family toxin YjjJ [Rhodoferax sp.]|nr:type II toxin-antitoxin system HipA family toxin YjjJ [Rhodoferax sp.]
MPAHLDRLRLLLATGPLSAQQIMAKVGVSQPTLSRAIAALGPEVVRIRTARAIHYAVRDAVRGLPETPVYCVGVDGKIRRLGMLIPVRDQGFAMLEDDGTAVHSEGLPWWLLDMRPQGFMGRAYASRHSQELGLPASIAQWSDTHALRALLAHGHDAVGNVLLGDLARDRFVNAPDPVAIPMARKGEDYVRLAQEVASTGQTWSSAAGEQPKFAVYAQTTLGSAHQIVKFSLPDENPITERWRDLLLAEHHALQTLGDAGVAAAHTNIIDHGGQRFLELERFDRVGPRGRCSLLSLTAVDAEFTGMARDPWPVVTAALSAAGHIDPPAHEGASLLYAFGTLIGNTDMHHGNLSFVSPHGRPYAIAPAYDMLPMGFQPSSGGALNDSLMSANLHAVVTPTVWRKAYALATTFIERIRADQRFSGRFAPCVANLENHLADADARVGRLADK